MIKFPFIENMFEKYKYNCIIQRFSGNSYEYEGKFTCLNKTCGLSVEVARKLDLGSIDSTQNFIFCTKYQVESIQNWTFPFNFFGPSRVEFFATLDVSSIKLIMIKLGFYSVDKSKFKLVHCLVWTDIWFGRQYLWYTTTNQ